jgi:hypothetical protein
VGRRPFVPLLVLSVLLFAAYGARSQPLRTPNTLALASPSTVTSSCAVGGTCFVTVYFLRSTDMLAASEVYWTSDYCSRQSCTATGYASAVSCSSVMTSCTYTLSIGSPTSNSISNTARFSVFAAPKKIGPYYISRDAQLLYSSTLTLTSGASSSVGVLALVTTVLFSALMFFH